jgi:type I restriction enzyme S subunit
MALRARLSPAREEQTHWPWHKPNFMALPVSALWAGERRMEAENYLASGYGQRLALQARLGGNRGTLAEIARVWQPSRLKGIQVSSEFGTPFVAATQVFDLRPVPRKFLSLHKTDNLQDRFIAPGTIVVTRSGSVGRATLITSAFTQVLISDDLLRVEPKSEALWGWTYAYLRSHFARSMMSSAEYGHIIKHLEPSHLAAMPVPRPRDAVAARMQSDVSRILEDRNRAVELMRNADALYEKAVGIPVSLDSGEAGYSVSSSLFMSGRRRLEGVFHNPTVRGLQNHFAKRGLKTISIEKAGYDLWLPTRFKRIPAEEGVELVGSADLFEMNPDIEKRIADGDFGDRNAGRVKQGWLLLARSGQTYGLNGTLVIANKFHEGKVVSDHVIRIAPRSECQVRAGYLYAALSHPVLGRPMVKSLAYGSSIPEIDVGDISSLAIPRLKSSIEEEIAEMTELAAKLFADADLLETAVAEDVDKMITKLLAGDWTDFVPFAEV